jgi:D-beta-D-heptose 7-phosphate kinase/D-beta-D-heptose 1-phosphate adenosyltransferase
MRLKLSKIITQLEAPELIHKHNTVFVSGSFDVLHLGHMKFLRRAKALVRDTGILMVAVISDEDIRIRKGEGRPVFTQSERVEALSYLEQVDYVIPWEDEWQALRLFVMQTKPAYLAVVAGDPGIDNKRQFIESAGGELKVLPREGWYASSRLIG